ncbi:ribosome-releasing factor 2, mitochondrial isoform X1 [Cimex lectularius]|uniref:Tr-type G domain-containing protein n=1 Tax=Cimex lectularius TaxID=79782 RepID=A0A8I6SGA4_CIMLE|nr:ribosome-releasing factor 2, mitochondrial isoform X1 [Cimex lectularius]
MHSLANKFVRIIKIRANLSIVRCINHSRSSGGQEKIRNIGILAHIDAGKTTTTERMLYFSGRIPTMGEVHDGNTVTDYLAQERDRGITITSAFVDLKWRGHTINLVDTPGHIDFTMEVEHALNVIDSAIIILDSTAGVEAQTVTVWRQAQAQRLPCLLYINKMDRPSANVDLCLQTLQTKLLCKPFLLHIPIIGKMGFEGIIDLPSFEKIIWAKNGKEKERQLLNKTDGQYDFALEARLELIDRLSSIDDKLADSILEAGSLETVTKDELTAAIKRITNQRKGVPVICGSSYKNIGIETMLDSVIDYLPSPVDSSSVFCPSNISKETLARSFKIIHDKQRGAIVFFRVYSGELQKGQKIYNVSKKMQEHIGKILVPFADDFEEIPVASAGQFVAVTGVKDVLTGDFISTSQSSLKKIQDSLEKNNSLTKEEAERLLDSRHNIPEPVFFCSIEPPSQAYHQALENALNELQREDPSLRVTFDEHTGQTILAGMGELHLEVIKDRIKSNYKIDAELGVIQIVYKEEFCSTVKHTVTLKNALGSHEQNILITMSLKPGARKELLQLDMTGESGSNLAHLSPKVFRKLKNGIISSLTRGPLYSSEVVNVHVILHWFEAHRCTPEPLIVAAAAQCIQEILKQGEVRLLEPIMTLVITLPSDYCSMVLSDLSKRRGIISDISDKTHYKEINCEAPLSGLLGYAKELRTMTSGTANLSMEFSCYRLVPADEAEKIITGTNTIKSYM